MKKTFKRLIAIFMATTTLAVGMGSMNASAITYKGTTNKSTTGGTGGTVNIRSRVYTDYYQPAGGVNVYYYGVVSDISTGSSLKTYFNITGTLTTSNSSTQFQIPVRPIVLRHIRLHLFPGHTLIVIQRLQPHRLLMALLLKSVIVLSN